MSWAASNSRNSLSCGSYCSKSPKRVASAKKWKWGTVAMEVVTNQFGLRFTDIILSFSSVAVSPSSSDSASLSASKSLGSAKNVKPPTSLVS